MVLGLCSDQHVFEVDTQRLPQTHHAYDNSICFCFWLVPILRVPSQSFSSSADRRSSFEVRHSIPQARCHSYDPAPGVVSDWRSHTLFHGHRKNSSVSGPHNQGTFAAIHRPGLSLCLQHSLPYKHISLAHPFDVRRCLGL